MFARVASVLGASKIGISSIFQPEGHEGEAVPVILMLHDAPHAVLQKAVARIARLPAVRGVPTVLRVEDTE